MKPLHFFECNWSLLTPTGKRTVLLWGLIFYTILFGFICGALLLFLKPLIGLTILCTSGLSTIPLVKVLSMPTPLGCTKYESICGLDIAKRYTFRKDIYQFKKSYHFTYVVKNDTIIPVESCPKYFFDEGIIEEITKITLRPLGTPNYL